MDTNPIRHVNPAACSTPGGHYSHGTVANGFVFDRPVQVRAYVDDVAHWPAFNGIYAAWAGASKPSRAVVPTGALHFGLKVEVEAVALAMADVSGGGTPGSTP